MRLPIDQSEQPSETKLPKLPDKTLEQVAKTAANKSASHFGPGTSSIESEPPKKRRNLVSSSFSEDKVDPDAETEIDLTSSDDVDFDTVPETPEVDHR